MNGQARISWHVEGDWIVLTIEPPPGVPAYELRASIPVLRHVARVQRLQQAAAGAELGPGLAHALAPFPSWIRDQFKAEGVDFFPAAFSVYAYQIGYGKSKGYGLPTDASALRVLRNPKDKFWESSAKRKHDRDKAVGAAQAWLKRAHIRTETHYTLGPLSDVAKAISKIPVLGPVIKAAATPFTTAVRLAEGERIDHAMLDAAKDQLGAVKAIAPYATTIISLVPGIGTGVAAAIAAGAALAEGKPIGQALTDAVRGAIPGGAIAQAGFDMARKIASGENVGKAALETARAQLPPEAQKAFDVGLAVVSGKKLQDAIAAAVTSFAPAELKQVLDVGAKAVQTTKGLVDIAKALPSDIARQGLTLAAGVLAHQGVNETQIRAMRTKLTGDALKGFDTALKAQEAHFPWLKNITTEQSAIMQAAQNVANSAAAATHAAELAAIAKASPTAAAQEQLRKLAALSPAAQEQLRKLAASKAPAAPHPLEPKRAPKPPAPRRAAPKPTEPPITARSAQNVPGWHGVAAGVGARRGGAHPHPARARAERAFIAANRVLELDENGEVPISVTVAQLRALCQLPQYRDAATRGLYVLQGVQQWRAGLRAAQQAGCCGESTILGAVGQASIVGGVAMPPAPIPVERLIRAGVRPGTY